MSTATSAADLLQRRRTPAQRVQQVLHAHPWVSPLVVLVVAVVVFTALNPRFASPASLSLVLQQVAVVGALAVGQTLVVLTAGIDLSVGAVAVLAGVVPAQLALSGGLPGPAAVVLGVAVGTSAGLVNGLLVTRLGLPPFIVTLGTLSIFTALALLWSGGSSTRADQLPALLSWTGTRVPVGPFNLTTGVLLVLALYLVVGYALACTAWGRHVHAVGDDAEAARLAGIRVRRVLLSVYVVAGAVYGLAAWVLVGRAGAASANAVVDANLESITAVVIGGTSLFGGRGVLVGTLLGALIVGVFRSGLSLAGVDDQYRVLAIGVLVVVAVSVDQWIRRARP